jgi:predicted dehydrogenase
VTHRSTLGIGVVGFGWMGQAHSRSASRIPSLFPERIFDTELVVCGDSVPERREQAIDGFGFREATVDWRAVVDHPDVDVVYVTAPNMMHEEVAVAAAESGKAVFCEKPVGGTPDQTVRIEAAARRAGVITGVGYNYRWAPLVQHAKHLIDTGVLGEITNYRGRFFSMYGADPMGLLSWRFLLDEAGYGVSSDILSHAVDLATMLVGPITSVTGTMETFIKERPLPNAGGTHYDRGHPDDPTGTVTNEDYAAAMVVFASGARGTFESSRAIIGPESQMAFDVYGTKGALRWNLETMNQMEVFLVDETDRAPRGYTTVHAGDRYPYHGHFVPGDANSIGYEALKVIENYEFLSAVARGEQHQPGFAEAVDYVSFQAAWLRSCENGSWQDITSLKEA